MLSKQLSSAKVLSAPHSLQPTLNPANGLLSKGIGAVLGQLDDIGSEYMCACISRSLNKHEAQHNKGICWRPSGR